MPHPRYKSAFLVKRLNTYKSWFDYDQPNRLNSLYTRHNNL